MEAKRKPIIAVIPDGHLRLRRKPGRSAEVQLKHSTDVWDVFFFMKHTILIRPVMKHVDWKQMYWLCWDT